MHPQRFLDTRDIFEFDCLIWNRVSEICDRFSSCSKHAENMCELDLLMVSMSCHAN